MRTAANILYVLQVVAIIGAIVSGHEFIDFGSAAGLGKTIGFFFPAILGAILEYVAVRKEEKSGASTVKPANTAAPKTAPTPAKGKAPSPTNPSTAASSAPSSVVYDADSSLYATPGSTSNAGTASEGKQFCPYCGAKLIAEGSFCTSCGKKLD